jgi:hypothetical protein
VLVPLRNVPDGFHSTAVQELTGYKEWKVQLLGAGVNEFRDEIERVYAQFMYPLTKNKISWHQQPTFDTKAHDAECPCGGIEFNVRGEERRCCGNPDWWTPRDAAAKAEVKKAEKTKKLREAARASAPPGMATPTVITSRTVLQLPPDARVVNGVAQDPPKGVAALTTPDGAWAIKDFDPTSIKIDDTKLTRVKIKGSALDLVGTTDAAAVKAARAAWTTRWEKRRAELGKVFTAKLKTLTGDFAVRGPGLPTLVALVIREYDNYNFDSVATLEEIIDACEIERPKNLLEGLYGAAGRRKIINWVEGLSAKAQETLITLLLVAIDETAKKKLELPDAQLLQEQQDARLAIAKKKVPWLAVEKVKPAAKAKKKSASSAADDADEDLGEDDEE